MLCRIAVSLCVLLSLSVMGCVQESSTLPIGEIEEWVFKDGDLPAADKVQLDELDRSFDGQATDPRKQLSIAAFLAVNNVNLEKQLSRLRATYLDYWKWATMEDRGETTAEIVFYLPNLLKDIYQATTNQDAFCLLLELQLDASSASAQTSALNELILANPATTLAVAPIPERTLRDLLLVMPAEERTKLKEGLSSLPSTGLAHHNARQMLALIAKMDQDRGGLALDE